MINGTIKRFTPIVSYVNKVISQTPKRISFGLLNHSHSMPEISKKINVIFVLGPPGSGKGIIGILKHQFLLHYKDAKIFISDRTFVIYFR